MPASKYKPSYRNQNFLGGCVTGEHEPELLKGMPNKLHGKRFNNFIRR